MTRKLEKSGRYFGPFTSVEAVRQTLKAVRKIWPYCAERKIKNKPCFYYQINRCLGACAGLVSRKEYMGRVIRPIILFLEGKKKKVIKDLELRIKRYNANAAGKSPYAPFIKGGKRMPRIANNANTQERIEEEIEAFKYQLLNMKKVLEHANVLSVGEKYASDVVELAKVLGLPKLPQRIEGYDISNIFGREAVGAMVVFGGGEPDKSEYRKFKIKIGQGEANDIRMLKEVLERRLKRAGETIIKETKFPIGNLVSAKPIINRKSSIENYQWPLPDLIIIDGGKAQLNAALSVLKKRKLNIVAIAISKGEGLRSALARDKIFFPGEKKPLGLPLASPALHLLKRVRDEAHRFAISYHRLLRKKRIV